MDNIYFYLLLGVFIYFLFTRLLDNLNQEHFDPSLIPVSSVVTLAKVAQKLTNPDGSIVIPSNLKVEKDLTVSDTADLAGLSTKLKITKGLITPDNTKIQWGSGNGDILRFQTDDTHPQMDIYDNGLIKIWGNETIKGDLTVSGDTNLVGYLKIGNKAVLAANSTDGWIKLLKPDGSGTFPNLENFSVNEHLTGQEMQKMLPTLSGVNSSIGTAQSEVNATLSRLQEALSPLPVPTIDVAARLLDMLQGMNRNYQNEINTNSWNLLWKGRADLDKKISNNNITINKIEPILRSHWENTELLRNLNESIPNLPNIMPGFAANNLYSKKDTTVNRNLDVINNLTTINTINNTNTTINGILTLQTDKAIQSTDNINRITFKHNGPTIFHSKESHIFRGGDNGANPDTVTLTGNNLTVQGSVRAVGNITATDIRIGGRSLFQILPWKP